MSGVAIPQTESGEVSVNLNQWPVSCNINRRSHPEKLSSLSVGIPISGLDVEDFSTSALRRRDILETIRKAGHRLATGALRYALTESGKEHGESTLNKDLSILVKSDELTNCGKCRPRGYGLPEFPCPHKKSTSE